MIFSCGRTYEQWKQDREIWHKWFAWKPVTVAVVNGRKRCVWLETVERKGTLISATTDSYWIWSYRCPPIKPPLPPYPV